MHSTQRFEWDPKRSLCPKQAPSEGNIFLFVDFFNVLFALYTIDVYMGICALHVCF